MTVTRIVSIAFLLLALFLGYKLYESIYSKIELEERIEKVEDRVKRKLEMIRDAEVAYRAVHGKYTSDWDKLINFVDSGKIFIVDKIEHIITLDYGADSVWFEYDTIGSVNVKDSLFNERKYPNFNSERLPYIPGTENKKFELFADEIERGGVTVDVFEAKDVDPINPARRKNENENALAIGSRTEVTTRGNWQ